MGLYLGSQCQSWSLEVGVRLMGFYTCLRDQSLTFEVGLNNNNIFFKVL